MQEIRRFKPSTVSRRFSVTARFHRTCVIDGILEHSPAEHVRRPAVPAESPTLGFTHLQFEALPELHPRRLHGLRYLSELPSPGPGLRETSGIAGERVGTWRGARGRRGQRAASGWEALTPTEIKIAALVAGSDSTSDIARGMFVSRRTVQTYISRILAHLPCPRQARREGPGGDRPGGAAPGASRPSRAHQPPQLRQSVVT
jgi:DNA-binding CsgD family transcriptional regulator